MKNLPEEIFIKIFSYLDNNSIWNLLNVCKQWTKIISNSSKLMKKFHLIIDKDLLIYENLTNLPKASIKNVKIRNLNIFDGVTTMTKNISFYQHFLQPFSYHENEILTENSELKLILKVINFYKNSIEYFEIFNSKLRSIENLCDILKNLKNLINFKVINVTILTDSSPSIIIFPYLKSVSFLKNHGENIEIFFEIFKSNKTIEKIELIDHNWTSFSVNHDAFNSFVRSLPNFKHLVMNGTGTASYFNQNDFPFKLTSLDAYMIGFHWTETRPRLNFLRSQIGNLKDLKLGKLPYDFDGGEVLKFIIEEMNLEKFYYGEIPLILNGQKQEVEEIWFNEVTVMAGMEMLRQFPSIKKLRFWLCATGTHNEQILQNIQQFPRTFNNLQELKIVDNSDGCHELPKFVCIYKACRNVKKLIVESNEENLCENLREFLPFMTQLEEIELNYNNTHIQEKLQAIRDNCLTLKMLKIRNEQIEIARRIFENSNINIETI
ncbi:hypothetical protein PVAND_016919 [Polypedilum vanderplanki]|uniref:F-box domain-containing protein n=1 Tax=Polypedilum vanderplanki TaxID=319348 RepID=A0A9J6BGK4_POLVA|nr:hypothetical protein PVAND_016919 [Polypedilum vanderplanki]